MNGKREERVQFYARWTLLPKIQISEKKEIDMEVKQPRDDMA